MYPESYYYFDLVAVDTSYNACSDKNKICKRCPERERIRRAINSIYGLQTPALINRLEIEKVIFNDPATIVLWSDGTKTVVKCANEEFDKEKGLAMAICKRVLGNKGNYFNEFRKWIKDEEEE